MNTLIIFGVLATIAAAYGASLPAAEPLPVAEVQESNAPEAVEELEPQESRGWGHHGGGWGHHGGGWGHHGGGWGHHGGGWGHYGGGRGWGHHGWGR